MEEANDEPWTYRLFHKKRDLNEIYQFEPDNFLDKEDSFEFTATH